MPGEPKPELVIVRRRAPFEDSYYRSGVWKIAHADFMTALMTFFLVMWLLHAANKEDRESVANYFNPIRLAEKTPDRKGLDDPKNDPSKAEELASAATTDPG